MEAGKKAIYIAGGRSVSGSTPGRKIASILACWQRMGHRVETMFGGDLPGGSGPRSLKDFGHVARHRKWYRRAGVFNSLIRTVSEHRDIRHHQVMVERLRELVAGFRPDLIWERSCRLHAAGLVVARQYRIPYVLEWKDNIASYLLSWYRNRARRLEKRKNAQADYIVTESEVIRQNLIAEGFGGQKILVAHNAADPGLFRREADLRRSARADLGVGEKEVLVGYLGSYAWYHDTDRLVQAMDLLRKRGVEGIRCMMVGAGKQYERTRRVAEKRGLLDRTILMKPGVPAEDVPRLLASLDVAVLPGSTDIICPIKIQEYMSSQLPVIAPDYACNREVITPGVTGELFQPKDANSLADRILSLTRDADLRGRLGRRARQEVLNRFTWEKTWGAALEAVGNRIEHAAGRHAAGRSRTCYSCAR